MVPSRLVGQGIVFEDHILAMSSFVVPKQPAEKRSEPPTELPLDDRNDSRDDLDSNPSVHPEFHPPSWASPIPHGVFLEVLKSGTIIESLPLPPGKPYILIGRAPSCDISVEHPSASRYHAALVFDEHDVCFIFDLASTHGTTLDKQLLSPRQYREWPLGSFL